MVHAGLDQLDRLDDGGWRAGCPGGLDAAIDLGDDGRMDDGFETLELGWVGEDDCAEPGAVDPTIARQYADSERGHDRAVDVLPGRLQLVHDLIGVDEDGAELREKGGDGALPAGDPAGQTDDAHLTPKAAG
jgi:hypothetical protein